MVLYPKDIFEKLEFNKILQSIKAECQGEAGKQAIRELLPIDQFDKIKTLHDEVDEWKKAIERSSPIPFHSYENIEEDIFYLQKEGYVLEVESIQRMHGIITLAYQIKNYFMDYTLHKVMPRLTAYALKIDLDQKLIKEIERVFDEEGNVRPNASDALQKISKSIHNREREVEKVFRQELAIRREQGYLTEGNESIRNSRLVLMVAAEHKRKIPGIIHDESSTGKTVFIEPENVLQLNNEVHNLYAERRAEIYKIIRELCNFLRPFASSISDAAGIVGYFDTIRAKALFAIKLKAIKPQMINKPYFNFKEAYNPILYQRLQENGTKIIPFDLELLNNNKFLILSGPNAGGKSVTLKSIGLLQLMYQSGIPITANENTKMGIFTKIFADIGDQQSIEDDLSTYSSHLTNMKEIVDTADDRSLILIDEFGSGTDPKIGGGIAEALLQNFKDKKSYGVITTHYSNLKFFAFKNQGFVNGSMEFDTKALKPTYQLIIGKPGSSFAFEIAQKTGLPLEVIEYAKNKAGKHEQSVEQMLITLQDERREFESKMSKVLDKEEKLDRLIKTYETLSGELEYKRKKLKLEQKELDLYNKAEMQKELQKQIKQLKSIEDANAAMKKLEEQKSQREEITTQIETIKQDIYKHKVKINRDVKAGDYAQIRNSSSIGKILSIDKEHAEVELGFFKMKVPLADLTPTSKPIDRVTEQSVKFQTSRNTPAETKLDLRGYRVEDAMTFLQEFLEQGILNNAHELRIIHGVGNGTLKRNVHAKLKEYKDIKEYWHPESDLGGEGVTYVKL